MQLWLPHKSQACKRDFIRHSQLKLVKLHPLNRLLLKIEIKKQMKLTALLGIFILPRFHQICGRKLHLYTQFCTQSYLFLKIIYTRANTL